MIDFNDSNRAIYLQIADDICDKVLQGTLRREERVPSVREYAAEVMVNMNTVMRAYDLLSTQGILYNKRGVGYFVAKNAMEKIVSLRLSEYLDGGGFDRIFRQWHMLTLEPDYVAELYREYILNHSSNETHD